MTSPLQKKLKITGPVVITANRLADGAVIYLTEDGGWTGDLTAAAVATTSEHAKELLAAATQDSARALDIYVAPVAVEAERVLPANLRERIRAFGPTVPIPGA